MIWILNNAGSASRSGSLERPQVTSVCCGAHALQMPGPFPPCLCSRLPASDSSCSDPSDLCCSPVAGATSHLLSFPHFTLQLQSLVFSSFCTVCALVGTCGCVYFFKLQHYESKDKFFSVLGCIRETIKKSLMDSRWKKKKSRHRMRVVW